MNKNLRIKKFLSVTLLVLAATGSAHATVLTTWGTDGFTSDNQVSFEAAGVTGSDLYTTGGGSSGFTPGVYNWDIWGSTAASNATFGLDMTADSDLEVDQFNFNVFNNDCQVGYGVLAWCNTVLFGVSYSINSGAFSSSLLDFRSPSSVYTDYTVDLDLNLSAGDTLSMQIYGIDKGSNYPGGGQYVITDISLTGSVPVSEPSILALMGLGLCGLGLLRRKMKK